MTNEQKNVPKLRFPEFKGEWTNEKVSAFLKESKIKGHKGNNAKN